MSDVFFVFGDEGTCLPAPPFWLLASSSIRWLSETVFIRNGFTAIDLEEKGLFWVVLSRLDGWLFKGMVSQQSTWTKKPLFSFAAHNKFLCCSKRTET